MENKKNKIPIATTVYLKPIKEQFMVEIVYIS